MMTSLAPGTVVFMPPEALTPNAAYDQSIDVFSLGVMIIHIFCGEWPSPGDTAIPDANNPGKVIYRSEAQRRDTYLTKMGYDHPLRELAMQCITNNPENRPSMFFVLEELEDKKGSSQFQTTTSLLVDLKKENRHLRRRLNSDLSSTSLSSFEILPSFMEEFDESMISTLSSFDQSIRSHTSVLIQASRHKASVQLEGQPSEVVSS